MTDPTQELDDLRRYVQQGDQRAFAELAGRYVDLVYSSALRQVRDAHLAEDVTQVVFAALAAKAGRLKAGTLLGGWLLTATRFAASHALRRESRRRHHEQKAAAMNPETRESDVDEAQAWREISPLLDEAVSQLAQRHRDAVVLRYFEGRSSSEMAGLLGISEEAARQLLSRAMDKLRAFFVKRGMGQTTSAGLGTVLALHAAPAAPAHVAGGLASAMNAAGSAAVVPVLKAMVSIKAKLALACAWAAMAVGIPAGVYALQHRTAAPKATPALFAAVDAAASKESSATISGTILTADDKPDEQAEVILVRPGDVLDVYGRPGAGMPTALVRGKGRFACPTRGAEWGVMLVRSPNGLAMVPAKEFDPGRPIRLTRWGSVEGTVYEAGKPKPGAKVEADSGDTSDLYALGLRFEHTVETDNVGHFVIPEVVPGTVYLSRAYDVRDIGRRGPARLRADSTNLILKPGASARVALNGPGGFTVTVKIQLTSREGLLQPFVELDSAEPVPVGATTRVAGADPEPKTVYLGRSPIDADGRAMFSGVIPGKYHLHVIGYADDKNTDVNDLAVMQGKDITLPPDGDMSTLFDLGTWTLTPLERLLIGQPMPDLSFVERANGTKRKLSEFRGNYTLLVNDTVRAVREPKEVSRDGTFAYWFGKDFPCKVIVLNAPAGHSRPIPSVLYGQRPVPTYAIDDYGLPLVGYVLISPNGTILGKARHYPQFIYGFFDEQRQPRSFGAGKIVVTAERNSLRQAGSDFRFPTIPPIQANDAARDATFKLVGTSEKASWAGGIDCLHDGLGARMSDNDRSSFGMCEKRIEGRFSVDLHRQVDIDQINTFSWHKNGGRSEQVYRVYACRGDEKPLDVEPALGTDPAACGWTFLANVDTRTAPGGRNLLDGAGFQQAVGIRSPDGSVGKWRHLLFVCLPTETKSIWGQTLFCEVDVIERD